MEIRFGQYSMRPFRKRDIPALVRHANNINVSRNLRDSFPYPYTDVDADGWVKFVTQHSPPRNLVLTHDDEAIGGIGLRLQEDVHRLSAEVGYWLSESYWGRGIVAQALKLFTDYAFANFPFERIYAGVFERNPASVRVLEKAGYEYEATLRRGVVKDGLVMDELIYTVLR